MICQFLHFIHMHDTYLLVSLCKCASYRQNGLSMVVHSFMNSIEPPGSADISQIPNNLCGSPGAPSDIGIHGSWEGVISDFASGTVNSLEQSGAQYMPLMMTEAYGAICVEWIMYSVCQCLSNWEPRSLRGPWLYDWWGVKYLFNLKYFRSFSY